MYHHDARDYRLAVGEVARKFQIELEEKIHRSQQSAVAVIQRVQNEVTEDRIIPSGPIALERQAVCPARSSCRRPVAPFQEDLDGSDGSIVDALLVAKFTSSCGIDTVHGVHLRRHLFTPQKGLQKGYKTPF